MRDFRQFVSAERLRHLAEYAAFRIVVCVVDILPLRTSIRLAEVMAWIIYCVLPKKLTRYAVARDNIRQAFGKRYTDRQVDEIIRRMWVHLFRVVVEIVQVRRKLRLYNCADVAATNRCASYAAAGP
jgi:Kdo2-lipid IVA lauroyltransferase/acyltransferase